MPRFPSLEWCEALVRELERDPAVRPLLADWGGRTLGVVLGKDGVLPKDFCLFARPHATEPRLVTLEVCEDEDELELEEPDYLFKAPFGLARKLLERRLDPLELLRKGQVKVKGDLAFLVPFSQRHQRVGEAAFAKVETIFP